MADPDGRPPGPEPGFRLFGILHGKRDRGSFLFTKACKSLYRRKFKRIEDAPFAAYIIFTTKEGQIDLKPFRPE